MAMTYLLGSFPDIARERVALVSEFTGLPTGRVSSPHFVRLCKNIFTGDFPLSNQNV